jgi:hypothetical protein
MIRLPECLLPHFTGKPLVLIGVKNIRAESMLDKPQAGMIFSRQMDPKDWGEDWPVAYALAKDPESAQRIAQMVNFALERAEQAEAALKKFVAVGYVDNEGIVQWESGRKPTHEKMLYVTYQ